jgi:hypothetical protein
VSSKSVIQEIADERAGQKRREGFTADHDDEHTMSELARAAQAYIQHYVGQWGRVRDDFTAEMYRTRAAPSCWPWGLNWWKPKTGRRDLVRAAALIVAEIERLDRQKRRAE